MGRDGEWHPVLYPPLAAAERRTGYFHTDGYNSRVYLYEQGPLYTYSSLQLYGEGLRYWLMARVSLGRNLTLTAKAGVTDYRDRQTIGSGYQQIDGSSQTDLDLQVRWKF